MEYHEVVGKIKKLLEENDCWFETFEHEPVRTSEEAAKVRTGYGLAEGAKALIVRVKKSEKDKSFAMVVIPGDKRFDIKKLKNLLEAKDIRFATEDEVENITAGVKPGGVPPFGNLFGIEVIADKGIFDHEKIIFNAGDKRYSIAMMSKDYKDLVKPRVEDVVSVYI